MNKVLAALKKGALVQVGTFIFFALTAPFLGELALLLMPGVLILMPEPEGTPYRGLLFWVGIVLDVLFYAAAIYGLTRWAERRRASSTPPSILS